MRDDIALRDRRVGFLWIGNREIERIGECFEGRELTTALAVYVRLCEAANEARQDTFRITRTLLAERSGVTMRTLATTVNRLHDAGLLAIDVTPDGKSAFALVAWGGAIGAGGVVIGEPQGGMPITRSPRVYVGKKKEEEKNITEERAEPDGVLPGLAPPPTPPPPVADSVRETWTYYLAIFGDRVRIKTLTPPRIKTLVRALKAVGVDEDEATAVETCKRAIDGLSFYRSAHPEGSDRVDLGTIFETHLNDSKNLTDKIEGWARMVKDRTTIPPHVPSGMRSRVVEMTRTILDAERKPDIESVQERAELIARELADRFKLRVQGDGTGKLIGYEVIG